MNELVVQLGKDWLATLWIGFLVASWWRGTWVLFDIWFCQQPSAAGITTADSFCFVGILDDYHQGLHHDSGLYSLILGLFCTFVGVAMMWFGLWRPAVVLDDRVSKEGVHVTYKTALFRVAAVYILGIAAVNLWRGVWYLTDYYLWPDQYLVENVWGEWPLTSFWTSSVIGSTVCFLLASGNSILAPPGIFLLDGPGVNPPPIAVTLLSSYYSIRLPANEKTPPISKPVIAVDILTSFVVIPFFVVWFWRGSWLVMDFYLWKFSPEKADVWTSIGWSALMAIGFMLVASETVFAFITTENTLVLALLGRLRTYVLAWGVVNYWRAVWYIWDELCGTSQWSCWICHLAPLGVLMSMGCMSCILAPASTIGVDVVPHPDCADEPLFSNIPVPANDLYWFAIGRDPQVLEEASLPKKTLETKASVVRMSVLEFSQMLDVDDFVTEKKKNTTDPTTKKEVEMPRIDTQQTLTQVEEDTSRHDDSEGKGPTPVDIEVDELISASAAQAEEEALADSSVQAAVSNKTGSDDDDNNVDEEAEMAAAWAKMEEKMGSTAVQNRALNASTAWASGATGCRGSYSSVRTKQEVSEIRASYFDLQRPDLDRRVSRRQSVGFVPATDTGGPRGSARGSIRLRSSVGDGAPGGSLRRSSTLFRNR